MTKLAPKPGSPLAEDIAQLERLLGRLAQRAPGYPRELTLASRLAAKLERRTIDSANAVLRPLDLTYVLYQTLMIIFGAEDGAIAPSVIKDRRHVLVSLTAAGRRLLDRAQPLIWATSRQRFATLTSAELRVFMRLVHRQLENLADPLP